MARSRKSKILIAHTIAWGGAVLVALIATYGTHGPAHHPKMVVVCLLPVAVMSWVGLRGANSSRKVVVANGILWGIAGVTAFVLANTTMGEGVPAITTTIVMLIAGAISLAILSGAKIDDAVGEDAIPDE